MSLGRVPLACQVNPGKMGCSGEGPCPYGEGVPGGHASPSFMPSVLTSIVCKGAWPFKRFAQSVCSYKGRQHLPLEWMAVYVYSMVLLAHWPRQHVCIYQTDIRGVHPPAMCGTCRLCCLETWFGVQMCG